MNHESDTLSEQSAVPSDPIIPEPPAPLVQVAKDRTSDTSTKVSETATAFTFRRWTGIICGFLGVVIVLATVYWAKVSITIAIDKVGKDIEPDRIKEGSFVVLFIAILIVEAVVSVAAVYFGYSMLRVAERLLVPRHLLLDGKDIRLVRAITGIDTPTSIATDRMKSLVDQISALGKSTAEIAHAVAESAKTVLGAGKK